MRFFLIFLAIFLDRSTLLTGLVTKASSSKLSTGNNGYVTSGRGSATIPQSTNTDKMPSETKGTENQLINAISLVAGTTVGAGILALPSVAIESGFFPSSAALIGSWVFMVTTGQFAVQK
jgi:Tryptophan/tyrosine permease family